MVVNEQCINGEVSIQESEYTLNGDYYQVVLEPFVYKYYIKDDGKRLEAEYETIFSIK